MIVQPPGSFARCASFATKYDVLLIADEVATGFGRTGQMFACEHEDVQPDLMCVAKGITGGYLPLAATFATQQIFDAFLGEPWEGKTFYHGHTYTGNPLACAAALASLDLFERTMLVENVAENASKLGRDARRSCATCPTSATSARRATWSASSWSRTSATREPVRPETPRSAPKSAPRPQAWRHPPPARRRDRPDAPAGDGRGRPADDRRGGAGGGCHHP